MAKNTNKSGKGTKKTSKSQGEELFSLNDEAPTATQGNGSAISGVKKTVCPVSAVEFGSQAQPVIVTIGGTAFEMAPKRVQEGKSLGYFLNGKVSLVIAGKLVKCQIGLNLTLIGSGPGKGE